jgi:two-component system, OmpR family, response regulator
MMTSRWNLPPHPGYSVSMRILVVEDHQSIARFIKSGLESAGFTVDPSSDGDDGYHLATTQQYDAIVLDIMLPGRDGLSILSNLREAKNSVPVILLTARATLDERLQGLNLGADDYLTKPFYIEELIARIHAVVRRAGGSAQSMMQVADLTMNLITHEVRRGANRIELTAREFNLLEYLMRSPGRVLSRTQLLEHVWGYYFDPGTNLIDVNIQRLRRKLAEAGDGSSLIETVRGAGYRIAAPEDADRQ